MSSVLQPPVKPASKRHLPISVNPERAGGPPPSTSRTRSMQAPAIVPPTRPLRSTRPSGSPIMPLPNGSKQPISSGKPEPALTQEKGSTVSLIATSRQSLYQESRADSKALVKCPSTSHVERIHPGQTRRPKLAIRLGSKALSGNVTDTERAGFWARTGILQSWIALGSHAENSSISLSLYELIYTRPSYGSIFDPPGSESC
ncbi:hypothetical protein DACRYDRAFT_109512 [Dacryopinax primogenitus]|uniref:Uncharacterized protein n=1 Tax=Dacryopinax primogenitus (strain DJM 731) TaxID=1858805 RepID=M5FWM6_DACPD|nr:uncharacterized protein DACRYDRAFT_109512 [Dacryopinax primogenitus]EJU00090.1 hypothetical protein DACRYDRAFT_109512 [Dacryopinax primogenitus]